jgi:hypothetical protein
VRARIEHGLRGYDGRYVVVLVPNITNVFYGRDVGYKIERIDLDRQHTLFKDVRGQACRRSLVR